MSRDSVNVGIGFVTGRKGFKKTARAYAENWIESGLTESNLYKLDMFVAYDLKYQKTKPEDFINIDRRIIDMIDYPYYLGEATIKSEMAALVGSGVLTAKEADLLFGDGYAKKRNVVVYFALKNGVDYLLFLDDDEYPMAVQKRPNGLIWRGQKVLSTHLENIEDADITYGHHCGYISPIPHIRFNSILSENDFRTLIETISNDIISWESIRQKMNDGGVTYAADDILDGKLIETVEEVNGAKFISGSNLCLNLTKPERLYPFYNPPGARGEDTFLSTCLSEHQVLKVPCYTFHDGFSTYEHLLCGTLPEKLKPITPKTSNITERFLKACIGWNRYKPLYTYITNQKGYDDVIAAMKENLRAVLGPVSLYFGRQDFEKLQTELDFYADNVKLHYDMFEETKDAWRKVTDYLENRRGRYLTQVR